MYLKYSLIRIHESKPETKAGVPGRVPAAGHRQSSKGNIHQRAKKCHTDSVNTAISIVAIVSGQQVSIPSK